MRRSLADPRSALIWRRLRSRFGISAPKVAVRTHLPWYWRAASIVVLLAISIALAGWVYDAGRRFAGFDRSETEQELKDLRDKVAALDKDLAEARKVANAGESKLSIEAAAARQLADQVKRLEQENGRLKEDLAVFENLAAKENGTTAPVSIQRFSVDPGPDGGAYRYRMLVAAQGGKKEKETRVDLQFRVVVQQGGKAATIEIPAAGDPDSQKYSIGFKYFRRVEGTFRVPADARVKSVEARLVQGGTQLASKVATL
ncbi:MAG TPA: hypothetical protein PKD29_05410 [Rhodocyclaceae bacterium]|nr:hypothetical protein [Rhodocyclaceae bacterium]